MRAEILEAEHFLSDNFRRMRLNGGFPKFLADGEILTEYAVEIASRKKDCSRAAVAGNGRLLAVMQSDMRDAGIASLYAKTCLPGQPVHAAFSRAANTMFKLTDRFFFHESFESLESGFL